MNLFVFFFEKILEIKLTTFDGGINVEGRFPEPRRNSDVVANETWYVTAHKYVVAWVTARTLHFRIIPLGYHWNTQTADHVKIASPCQSRLEKKLSSTLHHTFNCSILFPSKLFFHLQHSKLRFMSVMIYFIKLCFNLLLVQLIVINFAFEFL